ncbi:DUF6458 family protein [Kineococcus rubinsiae]|uniref:DUF6458 family protein n=1 Tax=Kineococcus rubinsiae TaxID=2609562 RepID=UPI001430AB3F|nr:DUF6458 family protein [Kineococcus rubinsiae]NIZ89912.1 hypothetical protein [Kineococcus rubinsiae]
MRLGSSIFLIALGAILAFAVNVSISGIDLKVVGYILLAVGVLGIILEFAFFAPRRRTSTTVRAAQPTVVERTTRDL